MPLFDFKCENCQMTQERMVKSPDSEAPVCMKCGGETQKQLCAPSTFNMKGPGFHCNDYKYK